MNYFRCRGILLAILFTISLCTCSAEPARHDPSRLSGLKTPVTAENRSKFDFTEKALEYLVVIDETYADRGIMEDESNGIRDACVRWITEELTACGYDPSRIEEQRFSGETIYGATAYARNIILTVPGETEEQIIIGAHYDGYGTGDNGSGVALMLAAAVGLQGYTPHYTLKYIFFDGEEDGKLGSRYYAESMTEEEIASTLYMINLDALAFGDFCNIYGGSYGEKYDVDYLEFYEGEVPEKQTAEHTEGYELAAGIAERIGFKVYRPEDLDGYYEEHGRGMEVGEEAFLTNPWTYEHPAPLNMEILGPSPTTICTSDHAPFAELGIPYIYFEATNWWAEGDDPYYAYTGYPETYDKNVGVGGQIMNTDFDTLEYLEQNFPGRAEKHFRLFSPLLCALVLVTI